MTIVPTPYFVKYNDRVFFSWNTYLRRYFAYSRNVIFLFSGKSQTQRRSSARGQRNKRSKSLHCIRKFTFILHFRKTLKCVKMNRFYAHATTQTRKQLNIMSMTLTDHSPLTIELLIIIIRCGLFKIKWIIERHR